MASKRRRFTPDQKAKAVIRHLQDNIPVSQICSEMGIHPNQFYDWQKHALGNLAKTFDKTLSRKERKLQKEQERSEAKIRQKDSVIAELLVDHMMLKKKLGED